jgi:hypothetical protein
MFVLIVAQEYTLECSRFVLQKIQKASHSILLALNTRLPTNPVAIWIVSNDQKPVLTPKCDRCCHIKVPPYITAGIIAPVLVLVAFQQNVTPGLGDREIYKGARSLRVEPTRLEWEMELIFKRYAGLLKVLV